MGAEADGERLSGAMLRGAQWLAMHVPRRAGLWAVDRYARLSFGRFSNHRRTVAANLARVLGLPADSPLVQSATRECFRLYARYWYETFALRSMPGEEVDRRFSMDGLEHIDEAMARGRGMLIALPHMGNWDAAGHWLCLHGYRLTAVAEELKPRSVYERFLRHRRALGINIVPLSHGRRTGEVLVRLLSENHVITLVADRDLTRRGVEVEMFGGRRLLPAGPAYLALATGAPLSVAAVFTTPEGWHCRINAPTEIDRTGVMRQDVAALTGMIASQFERFIASAPTDWHMFQPAWEEAPVPVSIR
jgi:lauroyl/myristoyl acyltransferase